MKNVNRPQRPAPTGKSSASKPSRRGWLLGAGAAVLGGAGIYLATRGQQAVDPSSRTPEYTYEIVNRYPHDPQAFTQGLVYYGDDILYEGTGNWDRSRLRKVELRTGNVLHQIPLPEPGMFGEGIALWQDTIIQLTWEHGVAFVYDRESFRELRRLEYAGQGWGLTHDGRQLIMSDGSATLTFRDPDTFRPVRHITVRDERGYVQDLNELEFIDGEIYANVWQSDHIVRISPENGAVTARLDLTGLRPPSTMTEPENFVLNGIAYDTEGQRLFVTGKHWPELYEIRQVPR